MKNLIKSLSFLFVAFLFINTFSSCKKDLPLDATVTPEPAKDINEQATTTLLALAGGGNGMNSDSTDYCDCFDIFDDVDWSGSDQEIIAQLEAILAQLADEEIEALFTPVCTDDGEVYENACVAECNGATNFEVCDGDDLCDTYDDCEEICFEIVFPIDVLLPDGTTATAHDEYELENIYEDWFINNPNSNEEPQLVYPFDVIDADSNLVTISGDTDFEALLEDCYDDYDDGDFEDCFTFVYPITVIFPDGTSATVNDDDELFTAVENWYDANPTSDEDPTLDYPVDVVLAADSSMMTINSDDELDVLVDDCFEIDFDDCFTFVFPLEISFPDGTTVSTNNEDEIEDAVDAWYSANPNSNEEPELVFPVNVELEDGTTQTLNNMNDLDDLFEECYGDMGGCLVTKDSDSALTKSAVQKSGVKRN